MINQDIELNLHPPFLKTAVNCRFFIYNFNRFLLFHRNKRKV